MQYRFVEVDGVVYCLHVDDTTLYSYNTQTRTNTVLVENAGSDFFFDDSDPENPVVYYTMSVTQDMDTQNPSDVSYTQVYSVRADATVESAGIANGQASYTVAGGKTYSFKVLKIDRENKKVSIGYKQLQPRPWDTAAERYAEGDIVHGKVVRIVPFGAFVELEKGIDGLVHVSQISHEWLENPTSVLTIGEEVDAKVLAFDPEAHKITLSIKALQPRPWQEPRDRDEQREGGERRRQRKGSRRTASDYADEEEYREWSDGNFGGASIADLLGNDDNK